MRTMEYYPFTGSRSRHSGQTLSPLWSNYYDDFDVTSGEYGFFIDFHLRNTAAKAR